MIRVLIAARSEIMCTGLETLLATYPGLVTVGRWHEIASLAPQVEAQQPDIVLAEIESPDDDTPAMLEALVGGLHARPWLSWPMTRTVHGRPSCSAPVSRRSYRARQTRANRRGHRGRGGRTGGAPTRYDRSLLPLLSSAPRALPDSSHQALSPREIEVLSMLAEGLGNKTIAWRLGISEHTIKFHLSSIFSKLNASSRTEAVTLGIRHGLIMI